MSIWDRYAEFVYRVATGNKRLRVLLTAPAALLFYGFIVLAVFLALWVDRWLSLPNFSLLWLRLGLSIFFFHVGGLTGASSLIRFFRSGGTPVPFYPPPRLITDGPYAYIRNPMFLSGFFILLGLGVLLRSLSLTFIFTPFLIVLCVFYVKAVEEKEMEKKFGQDYLEYKKRVPMFIPRPEAVRDALRRRLRTWLNRASGRRA